MNWTEITFGAVAITGLIEWVKSFDKEKKWKKYYKFLPLVFSIIPAILFSNIAEIDSWSYILLMWLGIFSFSILGYENIIETIQSKIKY